MFCQETGELECVVDVEIRVKAMHGGYTRWALYTRNGRDDTRLLE